MTSFDLFFAPHACPKCKGPVTIDTEMLPDRTYELVCLQCANRNFPAEMEIAVNMIVKLRSNHIHRN